MQVSADGTDGLVVKAEVASRQLAADRAAKGGDPDGARPSGDGLAPPPDGGKVKPGKPGGSQPSAPAKPTRFHGSVMLDTARVGRDAGRIAEEVVAHLTGLVGSTVSVTLEITAAIPSGAPDNVVRTVTENSRTLKFTSHGFETE